MLEFLLRSWCRLAHRKILRPVRGKYICATCLREWAVSWNIDESEGTVVTRTGSLPVTVPSNQ